MSIKPLTSFVEGLKNKITNPFFGTLIGVWIIHNYRFVYSVFTFDPNTKLDDRLKLVDKYFKSDVFLENLWTCIWHALIVLVATYLLLIISRAIVTLFDKRLSLWVYKYIYSKKIKSIEDFEEVVQLGEMAQKRYEEEQKLKLSLKTQLEDLESRFGVELEAKLKLQSKINELQEKLNNSLSIIRSLDDLTPSGKKALFDEEAKMKKNIEENEVKLMSDEASVLFDKFKPFLDDKELVKQFKDLSLEILKVNWVSPSYDFNKLLIKDLVQVQDKHVVDGIKYSFTSKGKTFLELLDHMTESGTLVVRSLEDMV